MAVRNYIDMSLLVRFNSRWPDIQDKLLVEDIQAYCKPRWADFLRKNG
jgi:hypothetical protein